MIFVFFFQINLIEIRFIYSLILKLPKIMKDEIVKGSRFGNGARRETRVAEARGNREVDKQCESHCRGDQTWSQFGWHHTFATGDSYRATPTLLVAPAAFKVEWVHFLNLLTPPVGQNNSSFYFFVIFVIHVKL